MEKGIYDFSSLSDEELILFYTEWIKELKKRNLIRTKNIVGELGEYLAIKYYNKTPGLPKLQATPTSEHRCNKYKRGEILYKNNYRKNHRGILWSR